MYNFFSKRKIIILFLSILITTLSACTINKIEKSDLIKKNVYSYYEKIRDIVENSKEDGYMDKISEYLKTQKFTILDAGSGNFIIKNSNDKSKDLRKRGNIFIISDFDKSQNIAQNIAVSMGIVEQSGEKSYISALVVSKENLNNLQKELLSGKEFLNISANDEKGIILGSLGSKKYNITSEYNIWNPKGDIAYEISIKKLPKADSADRNKRIVNPIITLNNLIVSAQNSDINVELSEFNVKGNINEFPNEASIIIVTEKGSQSKLEAKLDKAIEEFKLKNNKKNGEGEFAYNQVPVPNRALDYESTRKLISLLYTIEDGVFSTTEDDYKGDILSMSTISNIELKEKIDIEILSRYKDNQSEKELFENFSSTSAILDFKIVSEDRYPAWYVSDDVISKKWLKRAYGKNLIKSNVDIKGELFENDIAFLANEDESIEFIKVQYIFEEYVDFIINYLNIFDNDNVN